MAEVKAHYFDGIRNGNPDPEHITGNLHAFREAYLDEKYPGIRAGEYEKPGEE